LYIENGLIVVELYWLLNDGFPKGEVQAEETLERFDEFLASNIKFESDLWFLEKVGRFE